MVALGTSPRLVLLPRELGQVPPPLGVVGMKGRGLCQLLTLKARVPRFGIVCADAFDEHRASKDIATALRAVDAVVAAGALDEATLVGLSEQLVRASLRTSIAPALKAGLDELRHSFGDEELLAVRASVVGDLAEVNALAGALDAALGVQNLEETVHRLYSLAFHPRTAQARVAAGLPPFATRLAVVVQRLVTSEQSGMAWSLDVQKDIDERRRRPQVRVRATWGLAGGIGGTRGNSRIVCDSFVVDRSAAAEDGLADDARVQAQPHKKVDALRLYDGRADGGRTGTRMQPLDDAQQNEPALSTVQARLIAKEALRLEAAFGKPQAISFAYAGRLLHILDIEPLLVPQARVESSRRRTWDERLVPVSLSQQPSSTLTFSVWQRGSARGLERAGRLLGVRGPVLEETRPNFRRALGVVTGRITGNVEVLVALLELLPFADKARAALAATTGQKEIGARKEAPPPGFWQRAKQSLPLLSDDSRWPGQLERLSQVASGEASVFFDDVAALLATPAAAAEDPDALCDRLDALEEGLGKCVAALILHGVLASLQLIELRAALADIGLRSLENDLLGGDEDTRPLFEPTRRALALVRMIEEDKALSAVFFSSADVDVVRAVVDDDAFAAFRAAFFDVAKGAVEGSLVLDEPRLEETPERLVRVLQALLRTARGNLDNRVRDAVGKKKKAEYVVDTTCEKLGGLKGSSAKKRVLSALERTRHHMRAFALGWVPTEQVVAQLRRVSLALGERLFEHGLLDQPKDVFHLQDTEIAGVIRGTGPDVDVRPLVQARRRAVTARPPHMGRRLETTGVVATAVFVDDDADAVTVTDVVSGVAVVTGVGNGDVVTDASSAAGVTIAAGIGLFDLPLLAHGAGVASERGSPLSPVVYALRAVGVPAVVDAKGVVATLGDADGGVVVDGGRGVAAKAGAVVAEAVEEEGVPAGLIDLDAAPKPPSSTPTPLSTTPRTAPPQPAPPPPPPDVGLAAFLRDAISTDPEARPAKRVERPAGWSQEMPMPPAAGLYRMPSEEGAPVDDNDVVGEEKA
jgi:hypothetical protein